MTNRITLGLAQIRPKFADVDANLQKHLDMMQHGAEQGVQVMIFPELSLTGYYLQDLVREVALTIDAPQMMQIREASQKLNMDVVVGFVEETNRHNYYIAAAYISQGEILHVHHKVYLPTYGQFDDQRYFKTGEHIRAFDTRFGRVGMLICEDFWHASASYVLWMDGADLMLFHSASPGRGVDQQDSFGTDRNVNGYLQTYSTLYTSYVAHCNRVGFEGGELFWGGSAIYAPTGERVVKADTFDETLICQDIDLDAVRRARSTTETLRDERLNLTMRELERIRDNNWHAD